MAGPRTAMRGPRCTRAAVAAVFNPLNVPLIDNVVPLSVALIAPEPAIVACMAMSRGITESRARYCGACAESPAAKTSAAATAYDIFMAVDDTARTPTIGALLRRVVQAAPGTAIADSSRRKLENALMRAVKAGGLREVERMIRDAATPALPLAVTARPAGARVWTAEIPGAGATLRVLVTSDRIMKCVNVSWDPLPKPAPETRTSRIQNAFYDRYLAAGQRVYATPPQRISPADLRILLVGEFEADVNNGGFSQYLSNKGRARAGTTLSVLKDIGAAKTAAMLERALASKADDKALRALDDRFYRSKEDLAVLSMKAIDKQ
jgi:hypothetical protein